MSPLLILSLLSPLSALFIGYNQRFTLLWFYAMAGFIIDNLGEILKLNHLQYQWAGNVFLVLEFILLTFYYGPTVFANEKIKWIVLTFICLLFGIHTFSNSFLSFNMTGASALNFIYIVYGVIGFYKLLQQPEIIHLKNSPFFIINVGIFIYASANFLVFLFGSYLRENDFAFLIAIWGKFFISINILHYIVIGIGLSRMNRK